MIHIHAFPYTCFYRYLDSVRDVNFELLHLLTMFQGYFVHVFALNVQQQSFKFVKINFIKSDVRCNTQIEKHELKILAN